jgi:hypothetical protein
MRSFVTALNNALTLSILGTGGRGADERSLAHAHGQLMRSERTSRGLENTTNEWNCIHILGTTCPRRSESRV